MDSVSSSKSNFTQGANFSLVFYTDNISNFVPGQITSTSPLQIQVNQSVSFSQGQRVMLVFTEGDNVTKANAEVSSVNGSQITLKNAEWDNADRRQFPRYNVQVPLTVRAVTETSEGFVIEPWEGLTSDLSLGGAWLNVPTPVEAGYLVQVEVRLDSSQSVKVLGIVAHAPGNSKGFGIQFLDFVGGSRYYLHEFLSQKAA